MKIQLFYLLFLLSSCSAPIAYFNNAPRSSGLENKGDIDTDLDLSINPMTLGTTISWSPIQRIGLSSDYFLNLSKHDKLRYAEGRLIYYIPLKKNSNLEFNFGVGTGTVLDNRSGRQLLTNVDYEYMVRSDYSTKSVQINYSFMMDPTWSLAFGIRGRNTTFQEYTYSKSIDDEVSDSYTSNSEWNVYLMEPFIEIKTDLDKFRMIYRFNISKVINPTIRSTSKLHPNYNPSAISFGILFNLNNK